jgi:hypothetical protein
MHGLPVANSVPAVIPACQFLHTANPLPGCRGLCARILHTIAV